MTIVVTVLTVVVAMLTLLVAGLLRSHAVILRRLHELGAGVSEGTGDAPDPGVPQPAPDLGLPQPAPVTQGRAAADLVGAGPHGEAQAVRVAGMKHDTILAFLSSGCATCQVFWEDLRQVVPPRGTRIVIVTKGVEAESPVAIADVAPPDVTVVMSSQAWDDYEVPGSPYVVHIDGESGRVRGEGTGANWAQVERMLLQGASDLDAQRTSAARRAAGAVGKAAGDALREQQVDRVLLAAGIEPGDPSLYARADGTVEPARVRASASEPGGGDPR